MGEMDSLIIKESFGEYRRYQKQKIYQNIFNQIKNSRKENKQAYISEMRKFNKMKEKERNIVRDSNV